VRRVAVIGAGWAGATAARVLHDDGFAVEVFEASSVVGGHARVEVLNGVVYEPNGAHIFHTSHEQAAAFVQRFGLVRPYEHRVLTALYLDDEAEPRYMSWPPQVEELEQLPMWPDIARDLAALPSHPSGDDFETWVTSMMGPTLYRLFVHDYTVKQWGCEPSRLSSSFAPKRVELRRDGFRRLFRDRWELFAPRGVNEVIEAVLAPVSVTCGARISVDDLDVLGKEFDGLVMTGSLDTFLGCDGELEWRGIAMRSRFAPTDADGTLTPAYVINQPSARVPYTRTVETKHATGQRVEGTVVSEEYPGAPARHYPVPTVEGRYESRNQELQQEIADTAPVPVVFCGRLATYRYIDQDQVIAQGMDGGRAIAATLS
jgi:UDP-galactopyranose mutase